MVHVDRHGAADYSFYIDGCADGAWRPTDLPTALPPDAALHVGGSFALAVEPMAAVFETLLTRTDLTALTHAGLADALAYAQRVAAITCTRPDADPP